jgi:hypothetical protein
MTSIDNPSEHVEMMERCEVIGDAAWLDARQARGLRELQRGDDSQDVRSSRTAIHQSRPYQRAHSDSD